MGNEVLEQIIKIKDAVPKKQRILCNYLALNYEKIGVMTVAELAEKAGVGSTTVMRLVQLLGFDSYTTFKKALAQESLLKNTTPYRSCGRNFPVPRRRRAGIRSIWRSRTESRCLKISVRRQTFPSLRRQSS